jgi:hypothetical protein
MSRGSSLLPFDICTVPFDFLFPPCQNLSPIEANLCYQEEVSRDGLTGVIYCAVSASENSYKL